MPSPTSSHSCSPAAPCLRPNPSQPIRHATHYRPLPLLPSASTPCQDTSHAITCSLRQALGAPTTLPHAHRGNTTPPPPRNQPCNLQHPHQHGPYSPLICTPVHCHMHPHPLFTPTTSPRPRPHAQAPQAMPGACPLSTRPPPAPAPPGPPSPRPAAPPPPSPRTPPPAAPAAEPPRQRPTQPPARQGHGVGESEEGKWQ